MLAEFIAEHRDTIVERWAALVAQRLDLPTESRPQLLNSLPEFLDQLAAALAQPAGGADGDQEFRRTQRFARFHGEHRLELGADMEALVNEFTLVGETITELLEHQGIRPRLEDMQRLWRLIGMGTSSSVARYSELRDRQLGRQAARQHAFLAHELRNSLNTARLVTTVLQRREASDTQHAALLGRLAGAIDDAAQRVDDSLLSARLVENTAPEYERCDVAACVQSAVDRVAPLADDQQVALTVDVAPGLELEADPRLLDSVLVNLLTNGVRHSRSGGAVDVLAYPQEPAQVVFEIADSCGGMPADLPDRLFAPYAQGPGDRSGFGLGLAIVRQAVEAHAGHIAVDDRAPRGCCFTVTLPAAPPAATAGPDGRE